VRPVFIAVGIIVLLMGAVWALQGAWLLPATFMRGPGWIGIGAGVAFVGFVIAFLGFRGGPARKAEAAVSPRPKA